MIFAVKIHLKRWSCQDKKVGVASSQRRLLDSLMVFTGAHNDFRDAIMVFDSSSSV